MTEQALLKAKVDLYNIIANHAMDDYNRANHDKHGKAFKQHHQYSLSYDTNKAREIYHIVYNKSAEHITAEQEEIIKGFLLIYRTSRTEYLKDAGGNKYYNVTA